MRSINVCADDFGYHPAVNQAILDLLGQGRLSATSVISNAPYWPDKTQSLRRWTDYVRIGLHINLTEFEPLSNGGRSVIKPFPKLVRQAYRSNLSTTAVAEEIEAQLQAFVDHLGMLPSYFDGHQHVHQLPIIRRALLSVYERYYPEGTALIRISRQPSNFLSRQGWRLGIKPLIVALTGAKRLQHILQQKRIPHNRSFAGIYNFKAKYYRHYFQYFLTQLEHEGWLVCHPAAALVPHDPIASARIQEYAYLSSLAFNEDCHSAGVVLA